MKYLNLIAIFFGVLFIVFSDVWHHDLAGALILLAVFVEFVRGWKERKSEGVDV
jgi:hypothetical protein